MIDIKESFETITLNRNEISKLNKVASKYSRMLEPKEFTKFYDEIAEYGIEIDLITGVGDKSSMGGESWTVNYYKDDRLVTNSRFVYQVYKPTSGTKYDFNIYFS